MFRSPSCGAPVHKYILPRVSQYSYICRVDDGLVLYYPLDETTGTVAADRAPIAAPMDLDLSGSVTWLGSTNGVRFDGGRIGTTAPATKLIDALTLTSRSTVEVWCEPDNLSQSGPARILSIGADPSLQNFLLGQVTDDIEVRLLHTGKSAGADPRLSTADGFLTTALTHLVHVYDGTTERLYVNGVAHPTEVVSTGTYVWDPTDPFGIGNAATNDRPWRGTIRQVAVYDRALSPTEIGLNFRRRPGRRLACTGTLAGVRSQRDRIHVASWEPGAVPDGSVDLEQRATGPVLDHRGRRLAHGPAAQAARRRKR